MRINVEDIKAESGLHKTVPVEVTIPSVELAGQAITFEQPFEGEAEVWNIGDRMLVKGWVSGEAILPCSRCLKPFSMPIEAEFDEDFMEGQPGDESELDDEEELAEERTLSYYSGDEIDLTETVRDNVLLELPMKALCDEACEGLWSQVKQDAAEEQSERVDPRLAKLQELLGRPDSNS